MVEMPDFPPPPRPGDLVFAAFRKYTHLKDDDWTRFEVGVDNFIRNLRTVAKARAEAGSDVYISLLWNQPLSQQFKREAERLGRIKGRPEYRLWEAYALEAELRGE
ncbi:hypothetical protein ACFXGT_23290 [Streptomyces sp. NPDC059352]|uniref:hypothetical protein n=1 Tax=Streptomyces sp. NPDC059352 TaxID=3346810 RepID=UPI0036980EB8